MFSRAEERAQSNIERINEMIRSTSRDYAFVKVNPEEAEVMQRIFRNKFRALKIVKVATDILCVYKGDVSDPADYFMDRLPSRFCPPEH